jgi:hypothetical protein
MVQRRVPFFALILLKPTNPDSLNDDYGSYFDVPVTSFLFRLTNLLYEVTMVFFSPFFTFFLSHWPMQGPHAFASTIPEPK